MTWDTAAYTDVAASVSANSSASGSLSTGIKLAVAANDQVNTVLASLNTGIPLTGSLAVAASNVSANMTTVIKLAGTVASVSTSAPGELINGIKLAAAAVVNVSRTAGLSTQINLDGSLGVNVLVDATIAKAAIYANMIVCTTDLTKAMFDLIVDSGRVVGYEAFRDFIPGDYRYTKAAFRAILESSNSDRARLNQFKVTVDVPDIFDRGSATISSGQASAGVYVAFGRSFNAPPEITLTLKGGTVVAVPKIVGTPTNAGFTVMLVDPATGLGVAGALTWSAHGY
jgi:hypothetical protein